MPPFLFKPSKTYPIQEKNEENSQDESIVESEKIVEKSWRNLWCYFGNQDFKWLNTITIIIIHLFAVYSLKATFKRSLLKLYIFNTFYAVYCAFGTTGGAHRFYTHRSFKAKLPLRIILMLGFSAMGHNPLFEWVRDHRVHHKFSETDADPHNAKRGFFFSHCGWLMMKKHPEVIKQGKKIDMSDLLADPVAQFHQKYFLPLNILLSHVVPTFFPCFFWSFPLSDCFKVNMVRYVMQMNLVWSVNSAAHLWGYRPYDKNIYPAENRLVALWALGEGWHNYHHTFPWDYKTAEFGYWLNLTGILLNFFAKIGWAYDLKTASSELIEKVAKNAGDGTHYKWGQEVPESENIKSGEPKTD